MSVNQKIAASYTRTSEDKDDDYIIPSQIEAIRAYAQRNNLHLAYEFREEFTGTKLDRPELNKVRALIREKKIDALIIYRADRLARMQHIAGYLLHEEIFPANVELHVVTFGGRIRPNTRDVFMFNIESAISQDERDQIFERTQRGKRLKLLGADGHPPAWIGYGPQAKYGYEKRGKGRNTHYVIVEEEAAIVQRIFHEFVHERKRARDIMRALDDEGVPTPSVQRGMPAYQRSHYWCESTVYNILRQTAYTGVWYANKRAHKNGIQKRPPEEWVRLDFPELRLVDDETFALAQQMLDEGRSKKARIPSNEYLMARQLRCECGYAIVCRMETRPNRRKIGHYFCSTRTKYRMQHCGLPHMQVELVDSKVWECIEALLLEPRAQLEGLREVQRKQMSDQADALSHLEQARKTLSECERQLEVYADQEAEGLITRAMLRKKKAELDERSERAQKVIDEYEALLDTKVLTDAEIDETVTWLTALGEVLGQGDEITFADKRAVVEALNIGGTIRTEEHENAREIVLYLTIYTEHLARLVLERSGGEGAKKQTKSAGEVSTDFPNDKHNPRAVSTILVRIVLR